MLKKIKPYKDNLEYLADQFERLKLIKNDNEADDEDDFLINPRKIRRLPRRHRISMTRNKADNNKKLIELEKKIDRRLAVTDRTFSFEKYKKKKSLTRMEELIILELLEGKVFGSSEYDVKELIDLISEDTYERLKNIKLFQKEGRLVKEKIIEVDSEHNIFGMTQCIKLNNKIKALLLEEKGVKNKLNIKENDFFEIIKPTIPFDKVILHKKTFEDIGLTIEMIQGNTSRLLHEWGIKGSNLYQPDKVKKRRRNHPVTMLFYGAPGTGKTLTANAVAYTLKKEILTFDCSKILDLYVGESEKNVRKIFDNYREISKGMKNPPVLLLNEADQFLHRRINATRSVDNMYNQMQNIFLEQLERFEGILIATTNLIENLDSAFSRRFHHKIEFRRPETGERFKLWQVHIPEKAPLSDDVDLQDLAIHYNLSGGQIALVVKNAAVRAARRGDKIMMEDFIFACEDELAGNFDEKAKVRVGF